jgi:hypothetical protein
MAQPLTGMLVDIARRIAVITLVATALLSLIFFPWSTDEPLTAADQSELEKYYAVAYAKPSESAKDDENSLYVKLAKLAAEKRNIR